MSARSGAASRSRFRIPTGWVVLFAALLAGVYVILFAPTDPEARPLIPQPTLAVLPFAPGNTATEEHLGVALALDLLNRLQYLSGLQCIPRAQVLALPTTAPSRELAARSLGAQLVISGVARQERDSVELTLQLDDARSRKRIADLRLTESRDALFDLQRRAFEQVAEALRLRGTPEELDLALRSPTRSIKAWDYASQGLLYLEDLSNPRAAGFAGELFRRSIQLDPDYSQARSGLSDSLWLLYRQLDDLALLQEAERQARSALALRPNCAAAVVSLVKARQLSDPSVDPAFGQRAIFDRLPKPDEALRQLAAEWLQAGELEMAEMAWRWSVERGESHWLNWYGLGQFLLRSGRLAEAEDILLEAGRRSPEDTKWPQESVLRLRLTQGRIEDALTSYEELGADLVDSRLLPQIGNAYSSLRRWREAADIFRIALASDPDSASSRQQLAEALWHLDRFEAAQSELLEALASAERQLAEDPDDSEKSRSVAVIAAQAGLCQRALPMTAAWRGRGPVSAEQLYDLARVLALCGDPNQAIDSLRQAMSYGLTPDRLVSNRAFASLFESPGFQQLLILEETIPPSP